MSLDKSETNDYFVFLLENNEELLKEIETSKGFILEVLKKKNMLPSLDVLMDNITPFSMKFITENYQLNTEQNLKVMESVSEALSVNKETSSEDVEKNLIEGKSLNNNVILTFAQINKFKKEIEMQFDLDTQMNSILKKSVRKMTKEELLSIEENFLVNNLFLFDVNLHFFTNDDFAKKYKELILKHFKNPNVGLFENYPFKLSEKDFLLSLLDNTETRYSWRSKYSEMSKIPGFSKLINKYEYYEKFGNLDLSDFSDGEVENNPDLFKNVWLNDKERARYYEVLNGYITPSTTIKQFNTIVDEDFILKLFKKIAAEDKEIRRPLGYIDAEYNKEVVDKKYYVVNVILNLFVKNEKIDEKLTVRDLINLSDVFSMVKELTDEKYKPTKEEDLKPVIENINSNLESIYNLLSLYLTNDKYIELISADNEILNPKLIMLADQFISNNININNFYFLATYYKKMLDSFENNYKQRIFLGEKIEKMFDFLMNDSSVKAELKSNRISLYLLLKNLTDNNKEKKSRYDDKLLEELFEKTHKSSGIKLESSKTNFLAYEGEDISKLKADRLALIYNIRSDFSKHILKNKISVDSDFIIHCLHKLNEDDVKFLTEYVKIHRKEIDKDQKLKSAFLSSSAQTTIYPLDFLTNFEVYFKEMDTLLNRIDNCIEKREKILQLFPKVEFKYSRKDTNLPSTDILKFDESQIVADNIDKNLAKELAIDFYQKKQSLNTELEKIKNIIPYGEMTEKIEYFIKYKDFKNIERIKDNRLKYNNEPIVTYINKSSFNSLMKDLDDKSFVLLLQSQIDYEDNVNINFKKFSYQENIKLAEKLLSIYRKTREGKEDNNYTYKFLAFFKKENRDFIKEFAMENLSRAIIYSYDFLPPDSDSYKPKNYITSEYSVDEVYKIYKKLSETEGFFSDSGVNASYKHFFEYALSPRDSRSNRNVEKIDDSNYKQLLLIAKEKDPMFYTILANQNIFNMFLDYGKGYNGKPDSKYKTKDEAINNYFNDNFDMDVILKGLDIIVEQLKANPNYMESEVIFNQKVASQVISSIVHNTYYEEYEDYQNREYKSVTNEEDTLKLMKFLYEKAPMHFIERSRMGCANDLVGFFKKHIVEFLDVKNIENFILPDSRVYCEYFKIYEENSTQRLRLFDYIKTIINESVERKETKTIEYLGHLIKQNKFIEQEMDNKSRHKAYGFANTELLGALANNNLIKETLEKAVLKISLDETLKIKDSVIKKARKI